MRALLWIIAIFAIAAGVAMLAGANGGYVLFVMPPWRAQASLNLVIVVLLLSFFVLYFVLRVISRTLNLPGRVGEYRQRRKERKATASLRDAVRALFEGRFADALKSAKVAHASGGARAEAAIVAARAAHGLKDEKRYVEWIGQAAASDEGRLVSQLTEAELALEDGRLDAAEAILRKLVDTGNQNIAITRMQLQVAIRQQRWDHIPALVGVLQRERAITPDEARVLQRRARLEGFRIRVTDAGAIAEYWRELSKEELADGELIEQVVPLLAVSGQGALARRSVERLLDTNWRSGLARCYAQCAGSDEEAKDALSRAEKWLTKHPEDAGLLYSLGRQCMEAQIWGKARSYLEESLRSDARADVHCALAELMEKLEQPVDAAAHYRQAARIAVTA